MHSFNAGISTTTIPDILKIAEVKLVFKKKNLKLKEKIRSMSGLYL